MLKLLKYIKPYWKSALLAPLMMFMEVVMDLLQPTLMASIVDKGIARQDGRMIIKTGCMMIGIALLGFLGGLGCIVASSFASINFGTDLRSDVFKKIQEYSFANLDKFSPASLITRLTNDIVQVQNVVMMSLRIMIRAPLLCIGGLILAISINARLALIFVVAVPLLVIFLVMIIKKGFPLFTKVQEKLDRINAVIRENLAGVRVIKAFMRTNLEKSRFDAANDELAEITIKASKLMILAMPLMMMTMNICVIAVIWFGGAMAATGEILVGEIMAFINYMTIILMSLLMVSFTLVMFSRAKASADRISEVLETKVDVTDAPDASSEPIRTGSIVFENVSFSYGVAGSEPVLKNISFVINPGETVAILGGTGSGKTSLVNLITRLYDVTGGRVLVDGRDVRSIKLNTLRQSISYVLQESILFSGTIKDNIRWGRKDASDEEIMEAAKAAQAHDFIIGFKEGYDTVVGQHGVNLSGGQKQRLAIARALVKKPVILILDDSTSSVDMRTELKIQMALKEVMKDTTCIIIAQRISSVLDADRILILENGELVGEGTHEVLLQANAVYREIYQSQLGTQDLLLAREEA